MGDTNGTLEASQRREALLYHLTRFRDNLLKDCNIKVSVEYLLGVLERKISEHQESLVIDFLRNISVHNAHEMKALVPEVVLVEKPVAEVAQVERRGKKQQQQLSRTLS